MRSRTGHIVRRIVCGVALCMIVASAGHTETTSNPDTELAELSKSVLADPNDTVALEKLADLRSRQSERRRLAFGDLAEGLQAYIDGRYAEASLALTSAAESQDVLDLADAILLTGLAELTEQCRLGDHGPTCEKCGGTGLADCRKCKAATWLRCTACKGSGTIQQRPPRRRARKARSRKTIPTTICRACNGRGAITCAVCSGQGTTQCDACPGTLGRPLGTPAIGTNAQRAIEKTIAIARHLSDGGLDLYSPKAFKVSPRLTN